MLRGLGKNKRAANPLLTYHCQHNDILFQRVQTGSGFRGYSRLPMAVETPLPTQPVRGYRWNNVRAEQD